METIYIFNNKDNNIINGELNLNLNKDTNISLYNTEIKKIILTINDNVTINLNDFNYKNSGNLKIEFIIYSNATLNYNLSNIVNNDYNIEITINYLGCNSKVETNIHSLVNGNELIKIDGKVKNDCKDNELLEQVKVMLIDNGKCKVIPNMLINTNKVTANHKVAISNVRNNELFYLMGKGLSFDSSINLIKKSFLISNIKDTELNKKINEIL